MDIALRAVSLLVAYDLFVAHGAKFDAEFEHVLVRSIYEHGRNIVENLEWNDALRGNHFLCNVAGLLYIGAYLPSSEESDCWLAYGAHRLVREIQSQFHPDGTNFEGSTAYHRLSAETVLYATALCLGLRDDSAERLNRSPYTGLETVPGWDASCIADIGSEIPEEIVDCLYRMAGFTASIERPDGLVPQIGDNDNGRFLKLEPAVDTGGEEIREEVREEVRDHRHLLAAFAGLLDRPDLIERTGGPTVETELVRSLAGAAAPLPNRRAIGESMPDFSGFPDFGLYVWRTKSVYVALRCGAIGQNGFGGHAHNDQMSFEFAAHGLAFIVDPGTFVYTSLPDARNRFRSTAMHNTLCVEGGEQAGWREGIEGLFSLTGDPEARALSADRSRFVGEHRGFGVPHRRSVSWREDGFDAVDECDATGEKSLRFHLDPDVRIGTGLGTKVIEIQRNGVTVELGNDSSNWQEEAGEFSTAYGVRCESRVLFLADIPNRCAWTITALANPTLQTASGP